MKSYIKNQIVAAIMGDGAVKLPKSKVAELVNKAASGLGDYLVLGVVNPTSNPGSVNTPSLVVAVRGGTYTGYSNNQVDEGEIALFYTTNGGIWSKVKVTDALPAPSDMLSALTATSSNDAFMDGEGLTKEEAVESLGVSEEVFDGLFAGSFIRVQFDGGFYGVSVSMSSLVEFGPVSVSKIEGEEVTYTIEVK